ncbi:MAG: tRNA1(Val) (adenine(37)-N6)-methyltransferase [Nitrospirae bacterium]|nr:MAG: tRNA1(Val) (adenine(37)-N6)-methyltransferase [Nitrospirota bacterium]
MKDLTLDSISSIRLYQHKRGYRFSLDAVLLAGFIRLPLSSRMVADLGAGTGVIGLLVAKRYQRVRVKLVELQQGLYELCSRNILLNSLQNRVEAVQADILKIPEGCYPSVQAGSFDGVITNPPFRKPGTGKTSPYDERALARHEITLNLEGLLEASAYLLKNRGRFFIIYHPFRLSELVELMRKNRLEPKRMRFVHPNLEREANMVMIEAVKDGGVEMKVEKPLFVYEKPREYTEEVKSLLGY